jgi:hypothetical protein
MIEWYKNNLDFTRDDLPLKTQLGAISIWLEFAIDFKLGYFKETVTQTLVDLSQDPSLSPEALNLTYQILMWGTLPLILLAHYFLLKQKRWIEILIGVMGIFTLISGFMFFGDRHFLYALTTIALAMCQIYLLKK